MPRLVSPVIPSGRLRSSEQPTLPSSDLELRPWCLDDAASVAQAFSDPAIQQWHLRTIESASEAREWIESWGEQWLAETNASWAVVDADGDVCGQVSLRGLNLSMGVSQVSYWVSPRKRGRNVATRAVLTLREALLHPDGWHDMHVHGQLAPVPDRTP